MKLKTIGGNVVAIPVMVYQCGACGRIYEEKPKECDCGVDIFTSTVY